MKLLCRIFGHFFVYRIFNKSGFYGLGCSCGEGNKVTVSECNPYAGFTDDQKHDLYIHGYTFRATSTTA